MILDSIAILLLILIWHGYFIVRGSWLYLYTDGFVYDRRGHIQGYHVEVILSVDVIEFVNTSNWSSGTPCVVKLENGEQRRIKHGDQVKSRVERYQRQLHTQRREQQKREPG